LLSIQQRENIPYRISSLQLSIKYIYVGEGRVFETVGRVRMLCILSVLVL